MKLSTFIAASKAIGLPSGNYILKSQKTGVLFWFMVSTDLDKTLKFRYERGSSQYKEFDLYRSFEMPWETKWIEKLYTKARQLIKRKKA